MEAIRNELSIKHFFIYNVMCGQKEGEEDKKIMFYYPQGTNVDIQIKDVGLSEAIIKFSSTFSKDVCQALHTQKTRRFFFNAEDNFWIVLTLNVATSKKGKDGMDGTDYHGNEVQNDVFLSVLKQSYLTARLFIGPFGEVLEREGGDTALLKKKLDSFFSQYLSDIRLKNCNVTDILQGVRFLPLDSEIFLSLVSAVNSIESTNSVIEYSMLLSGIKQYSIVWSGLPQDDTQIIYRYLTNSLLPSYVPDLCSQNGSNAYSRNPTFINGPNVNDVTFNNRLRKVYLHSVSKPGLYSIVVCHYQPVVYCCFINGEVGMEFFRHLDTNIRHMVDNNRDELLYGGNPCNEETEDSSNHSLYFNKMNLAIKSNISGVPRESLYIMADIHSSFSSLEEKDCSSGETIIKTMSGICIVAKMSGQREYYISFKKKKCEIKTVIRDSDRVCSKNLKRVFFHV